MRGQNFWARERGSFGNLQAALTTLLHHLGVRVMRSGVSEQLLAHPLFPGMESAIDALEEWNVEAHTTRYEPDELGAVPTPCLVRLREGAGVRYVMLFAASSQSVTYVDTRRGWVNAPARNFLRDWKGEVIVAAPRPGAGEWGYEVKRRRELVAVWFRRLFVPAALVLSALTIFSAAAAPSTSSDLFTLLAVKTLGLILCAFLMAHYFSGARAALRRICPTGKRLDCGSVLSSPAARFFGVVPLADLGAVYFLSGIHALILGALAGQTRATLWFSAIVNCLTLPFTFFSLYYQGAVLRRWCWLCVGVQATLWLEFALLSGRLTEGPAGITPQATALFFLAYGWLAIVWVAIRPSLIESREGRVWRQRYARLRNDLTVIDAKLREAEPENMGSFTGELVFGSSEAPHRLTLVLHPQCVSCALAHADAQKIQRAFPEQLSYIVRFYCPQIEGAGGEVVRRVAALTLAGECEQAKRALSEWFTSLLEGGGGRRDRARPEAVGERLSPPDLALGEERVRAYTRWSGQCGLRHTPTIFYDERMLPSYFDLTSLKYHLKYSTRQAAGRGRRPLRTFARGR